MSDLAKLTVDELDALLLLLGEQAQQVTNATTLVRQEQAARAKATEVPADLGAFGSQVLADAIAAAPARAIEIDAQRVADAAAEEAATAAALAAEVTPVATPDPGV